MYNNLALIFGHIVGDYFFQSADTAINKDKPHFEGLWPCIKHCFSYSFWVTVFVLIGGWRIMTIGFMGTHSIFYSAAIVFAIAFITHYPIDRYSLAKYWMKMIKQSDFDNTPLIKSGDAKIVDYRSLFVPIIYVMIDNGLHLILMWFLLSIAGK